MFQNLSSRHPDKVAAVIGFDEPLAHQIEAGSDVYLMPSRFEPCGLNQMYSLAYGTMPLVRAVGGLADSVVDFNPGTRDRATGVVFKDYDGRSFFNAVKRSVNLYHQPTSRRQVVRSGMKRDSSWLRSAEHYVSVYRKTQALNKVYDD
jgi:starch synthase